MVIILMFIVKLIIKMKTIMKETWLKIVTQNIFETAIPPSPDNRSTWSSLCGRQTLIMYFLSARSIAPTPILSWLVLPSLRCSVSSFTHTHRRTQQVVLYLSDMTNQEPNLSFFITRLSKGQAIRASNSRPRVKKNWELIGVSLTATCLLRESPFIIDQ